MTTIRYITAPWMSSFLQMVNVQVGDLKIEEGSKIDTSWDASNTELLLIGSRRERGEAGIERIAKYLHAGIQPEYPIILVPAEQDSSEDCFLTHHSWNDVGVFPLDDLNEVVLTVIGEGKDIALERIKELRSEAWCQGLNSVLTLEGRKLDVQTQVYVLDEECFIQTDVFESGRLLESDQRSDVGKLWQMTSKEVARIIKLIHNSTRLKWKQVLRKDAGKEGLESDDSITPVAPIIQKPIETRSSRETLQGFPTILSKSAKSESQVVHARPTKRSDEFAIKGLPVDETPSIVTTLDELFAQEDSQDYVIETPTPPVESPAKIPAPPVESPAKMPAAAFSDAVERPTKDDSHLKTVGVDVVGAQEKPPAPALVATVTESAANGAGASSLDPVPAPQRPPIDPPPRQPDVDDPPGTPKETAEPPIEPERPSEAVKPPLDQVETAPETSQSRIPWIPISAILTAILIVLFIVFLLKDSCDRSTKERVVLPQTGQTSSPMQSERDVVEGQRVTQRGIEALVESAALRSLMVIRPAHVSAETQPPDAVRDVQEAEPGVTIQSEITFPAYFKSGKIWPTIENREDFDSMLAQLIMCDGNLLIIGHTSQSGREEDNYRLGLRRAEIAGQVLIREGIPIEKLRYHSMGSRQPVADDSTQQGKTNNRRVTVKCVPF